REGNSSKVLAECSFAVAVVSNTASENTINLVPFVAQTGPVHYWRIVLKKSPALNLGPFPRNIDSISVCALNHCCISKAQLDRKLRAKNVLRLFQHNRRKADFGRMGVE
ncbi:MAG TPA: hypothetical protein VMO78_16985, partial [Rhizomicrobium sp.]|nr:hypothetical protein [Rhizomicrobium sp.]